MAATAKQYDQRITEYELAHKFIGGQINSFLKTEDGNGFIGGDLHLVKKIGTDGIYGTVYETILVKTDLDTPTFVTKLMPSAVKENINEVRVNKFVTELVKRKVSKHFLMTHQDYEVDHPDYLDKPDKKKKHYIVINEVAQGDLKALIADTSFTTEAEIVFNACIQCLLSVVTLHSYNFVHNDCHYGNFLFHKYPSEVGYYHYTVYGKDYYLKDCGYNMMIYDFGLIMKNDGSGLCQNLGIDDYRRVLPFFMVSEDTVKLEKDAFGVIQCDNKALKPLSLFCQNLHYKLFKDIRTDEKRKAEKPVAEYVLSELLQFAASSSMQHVFLDSAPAGCKIINAGQPFVITDVISKDIKKLIPRVLKTTKK
jgi:hypothetical protein